jgi:hypothetical protein
MSQQTQSDIFHTKLIPDIEKYLPVAIFKMATTIPHKTGLKNKLKATFDMLNFCGIVAVILKMETGRNFSMSGINTVR